MFVTINGSSHGGTGGRRWRSVHDSLRASGLAFDTVEPESAEASDAAVRNAVDRGADVVVAAGGDGTVNRVLNALMDPAADRPRQDVVLGAIGLGSSNDFHKPFHRDRKVRGVPVRVRTENAERVDIGKATIEAPDGKIETRYFLLNASVGVVADGNAFFNDGDLILRRLKRIHTEVAILYAALSQIARHRPRVVTLSIDGGAAFSQPLTNLGVLKSPHFAGGMRYDTGVTRDDGAFDVNVWLPMSRLRILRTVAALYRGRFASLPHTRCLRARELRIEAEEAMPLELDGEIVPMRAATISVLPQRLRLCG